VDLRNFAQGRGGCLPQAQSFDIPLPSSIAVRLMTQARFTLTFKSRALDAAQALADAIDEHIAIDALAVTINETDEAQALWNTIAYFETEAEARTAHQLFKTEPAEIDAIPDVDWVRESLLGLAPVTAGRFFLHGAHDRHIRRAGGTSIEVDAGTAFGTGHHGTTAGCLLALDAIIKRQKPKRIFDLGCGTGVLAIAAAKATGNPALASDIDPEAVRVTKLNAILNGTGPRIKAATAPGLKHQVIASQAPYDLIFANILARPLAHLAHGLSRILAPQGQLILSGLTRDQIRWISACYRNQGLTLSRRILQGNWAILVFTNPKHKTLRSAQSAATGPGWELD
jgi:ribosomal protein L11 methyltransferase